MTTTDKEVVYPYSQLLDRFFVSISEREETEQLKRLSLPVPNLIQKGGRRMIWTNFQITCQAMNRDQEQVKNFILEELLAEGSIDGQCQLVIVGRFQSQMILTLLRKYVSQFVICQICKRPNTSIVRQNRLTILKCNSCFSVRTI